MRRSLYDINGQLLEALEAQANDETPNDEAWIETIKAIEMEREEKIDNICSYIKTLNYEAESIKAEEKALAERRKRAENRANWLEGYLRSCVEANEAFKTPRNEIKWRKSEQVEIINDQEIPDEFMRVVPEQKAPDKVAIKAAIKGGEIVAGCRIATILNMAVK